MAPFKDHIPFFSYPTQKHQNLDLLYCKFKLISPKYKKLFNLAIALFISKLAALEFFNIAHIEFFTQQTNLKDLLQE
jgi:hypothetical protein